MNNEEAEIKITTWFDKVSALCIAQGAPEGWKVSVSSVLGGPYPAAYTHYKIDGAVYPPLLSGKRKGKPNYKKPIPGTERSYIFDAAVIRAL